MLKKITIVLLIVFSLLGFNPQRTTSQELQIPLTLEEHMASIFGEKSEIAIAVLKHESGLKLDAKNWNCIYYNNSGSKYSTFCKPQDRHLAWSVDCGIAQVNIRGKECPSELMTLEGNMERVREIYEKQGLNAWVSYKTGRYKKYL